ncbi:hypothetical protein HNR42_000373 [Deinobacterium chartae]|uniref:Uncharacterized protein n=1 Tax=Deinobacterium chartae TaxID=521158 RepID=A0A841HU50_9DEIO|nr:hypothetical protein [Deinobacterium chartae]MBB6096961.1 hypothetical protein [Deinobacterium chartae]
MNERPEPGEKRDIEPDIIDFWAILIALYQLLAGPFLFLLGGLVVSLLLIWAFFR